MKKSTTTSAALTENVPQTTTHVQTHDPNDSRTEESSETHQVQLTEYEDNSSAVQSSAPMKQPDSLWEGSNTLPNQELRAVLSRSYQLGVYTWNTEGFGADLIPTNAVLETLLAIPNINEKVRYFKYFRCKGVRLTFRLNSTQWHYGTLCISSTVNDSAKWHNSTVANTAQFLNNRPLLLDATVEDAVDYEVHWKSSNQWYDVLDGKPNAPLQYRVTVAVPLSMIGDTLKPARLTVFANFIDPEVALPLGDSLQPFMAHEATQKVRGVFESSKEAEDKSESNNVLSTVSSVTDTVFEVFDSVSSVAMKLAPLLPMLMDKPSTLQPTSHMVVLPGADMPGFDGLDTGVKLCGHQAATAGWSEGVLGESLGNPSIYQMVRTPGFISAWSFNEATAAGTLLYSKTLSMGGNSYAPVANTFTPSPLAWYSTLFKFWRGSLKFMFHFVTSTFVTARIRIVWIPPDTAAPVTISDNESGDFVSEVVEISGTMDHVVSVPYINRILYKTIDAQNIYDHFSGGQTSEISSLGTLAIYLVTPVVTIDSVQTIKINALTFISAGEDFQFSNFATTQLTGDGTLKYGDDSALEGVHETSVFDAFNEEFPTLITARTSFESGIAKCEEYSDIVTLGKRYEILDLSPDEAQNTSYLLPWSLGIMTDNGASSMTYHQWLTACFVNFRGSKRYKVTWFGSKEVNSAVPQIYGAYTTVPAGNTAVFTNGPSFMTAYSANRWIEFEAAWVTSRPFLARASVVLNALGLDVNLVLPATGVLNEPVGKIAVAFGDDFAVGVYQAPPVLVRTPPVMMGSKGKALHVNK